MMLFSCFSFCETQGNIFDIDEFGLLKYNHVMENKNYSYDDLIGVDDEGNDSNWEQMHITKVMEEYIAAAKAFNKMEFYCDDLYFMRPEFLINAEESFQDLLYEVGEAYGYGLMEERMKKRGFDLEKFSIKGMLDNRQERLEKEEK